MLIYKNHQLGGERYPQVNKAIRDAIEVGALSGKLFWSWR